MYNIPNTILGKIDKNFIELLKNNIREIFPNADFNDEEFVPNLVGTSGFKNAIKPCLKNIGNNEWMYYSDLDWFDSDDFDYEILQMILE